MATAEKRKTPSAGAASRRWQEVVDVSAEVFYRLGYSEASVGDVAAALGITKGSLYHYVQNKEDLLYAIIREAHDLTSSGTVDVSATTTKVVKVQKVRSATQVEVSFLNTGDLA